MFRSLQEKSTQNSSSRLLFFHQLTHYFNYPNLPQSISLYPSYCPTPSHAYWKEVLGLSSAPIFMPLLPAPLLERPLHGRGGEWITPLL
jgi:hypothetical protein